MCLTRFRGGLLLATSAVSAFCQCMHLLLFGWGDEPTSIGIEGFSVPPAYAFRHGNLAVIRKGHAGSHPPNNGNLFRLSPITTKQSNTRLIVTWTFTPSQTLKAVSRRSHVISTLLVSKTLTRSSTPGTSLRLCNSRFLSGQRLFELP